jgi:uncharacterized membrane protein
MAALGARLPYSRVYPVGGPTFDHRRAVLARLKENDMKMIRMVLGVLLVCIGVVWILQGINVLPGSFMTGQRQWAVYGAIAVVVGIGLLAMSRGRRVG